MENFLRPTTHRLIDRLTEPVRRIIVVAGPRQIGKTTAVHQALRGRPVASWKFHAVDAPDTDTNAPLESLDDQVTDSHVGNVIYLGGWEGFEKVRSTSEHLEGLVSEASTGGVGLIIAADQEGGIVHQLRGEGFTRPPRALDQAQQSPADLTAAAAGWGCLLYTSPSPRDS